MRIIACAVVVAALFVFPATASAELEAVVASISVPQFKTDNVYNPCRVKLPRVPWVLETDEERCVGGSVPKLFKRSKRTEWVIVVSAPNEDQIRSALERCIVVGVGAAAAATKASAGAAAPAAAEVGLAAFKGCLVLEGIDAATSLRTRDRYSDWSPV